MLILCAVPDWDDSVPCPLKRHAGRADTYVRTAANRLLTDFLLGEISYFEHQSITIGGGNNDFADCGYSALNTNKRVDYHWWGGPKQGKPSRTYLRSFLRFPFAKE